MEPDPLLDELDEDVAETVRRVSEERGIPVRRALNDLVRTSLGHVPEQKAAHQPFHTEPLPVGKQLGSNLDNIPELLTKAEGETFR